MSQPKFNADDNWMRGSNIYEQFAIKADLRKKLNLIQATKDRWSTQVSRRHGASIEADSGITAYYTQNPAKRAGHVNQDRFSCRCTG